MQLVFSADTIWNGFHVFARSIILLGVCLSAAPVPTRVLAQESLNPEVLEHIKQATVLVKVTSKSRKLSSSGFFIRDDVVVTDAHVLGNDPKQTFLPDEIEIVRNSGSPDESTLRGKLLYANAAVNLAFVQLTRQQGVRPLEVLPSDKISETTSVFILGYPFGQELDTYHRNPTITIAAGSVSSLRRNRSNQLEQIQINGSLIPGTEGGPIVDTKGRLVAISSGSVMRAQIGFGIPGAKLLDLIDRVPVLRREASSGHESLDVAKADAPVTRNIPSSKNPETNEFERVPFIERPTSIIRTLNKETSWALLSRFAETPPIKPVQPIMLPEVHALPAKLERDSNGQPITVLNSEVETRIIGESALIQLAVRADGSEIYAIFADKPSVSIIDPATLERLGEISVAKQPISLWCDQETIVVACRESQVVSLIDIDDREIKHSIRYPDTERQLYPMRIVGRAPNGSIITIWNYADPKIMDRSIWLIDHQGQTFELMRGPIDWCAFGNKANYVWTQQNTGSPFMSPTIYLSSLLDPQSFPILRLNTLGNPRVSLNQKCGHAFLAADQKHLMVPMANLHVLDYEDEPVVTAALRPDMREIGYVVPGNVIAENAPSDCFVSWRVAPRRKQDVMSFPESAEVLYASRSTGRIVRKISVTEGLDLFSTPFLSHLGIPRAVFVPGHELFVFHDHRTRPGEVKVIRCGPVARDVQVTADPAAFADNVPPKVVVVGRPLSFTPNLIKPHDLRELQFQIKTGATFMTIDPNSGELTFAPNPGDEGLYDVVVVAKMDGIEVPVIKWTLRVNLAD